MPELGRSQAEIALTKKLSATLVQSEVIEPMNAMGWRHGTPPTPEQIAAWKADQALKATALAAPGTPPPTSGQPAKTEGAPAPVAAPVVPVSGQPAGKETPAPVTPVAKTDAPATTSADQNVVALFESLRDASGKIMGKYDTIGEALKGAGHLANMAKTVLRENEQLKSQLSAAPAAAVAAPPIAVPTIAPAPAYVPVSRPALVAAKARLDKVLSKVNDSGFDGDSAKEYAEANREVAEQTALAVAAEADERKEHARRVEEEKWNGINAYMAKEHPDSVHVNSDEFSLFLSLNPRIARAMSALRATGQDLFAAELGFTEFAKARGSVTSPALSQSEAERKEVELAEREKVRIEARDAALKDAGIVHGSAGGSSAVESPGITGASQADINALADAMRREGDAPGSPAAMAWRRAVLPELYGGR